MSYRLNCLRAALNNSLTTSKKSKVIFFPVFFIGYVFLSYSVHHSRCFLSKINGSSQSSYSLVARLQLKMCFWPAKTRSNLNFLRCIRDLELLLLTDSSNINEGIKIQLFFHFLVLVYSKARFLQLSFSICVSGVRLKFSPMAVLRKHLLLVPKILLDHEWIDFGVYSLSLHRFANFIPAWTKICKNCQHIIRFDHMNSFRLSF